MIKIKSQFDTNCATCGKEIDEGDECLFDFKEKIVHHVDCVERKQINKQSPIQPVQDGVTARFNPPPSYVPPKEWQ